MSPSFSRIVPVFALALSILSCGKPGKEKGSTTEVEPIPAPRADTIDILFTHGSEKEDWVKAVTADFNAAKSKISSGKFIWVSGVPNGSEELIEGLMAGTDQPHLPSPASAAFIGSGNARWRAKTGKDLIGPIPETQVLQGAGTWRNGCN